MVAAPSGRRRRPSGESPPLPRHVDRTARGYLLLSALAGLTWVGLAVEPVARLLTAGDLALLRVLRPIHTGWLDATWERVELLDTTWSLRLAGWATILLLLAVRRFAHLAIYLAGTLFAVLAGAGISAGLGRMRPAGVQIEGPWTGYACPSMPVLRLAVVASGIVYTLLPPGRARWLGRLAAGAVLLAVCFARLQLAVDAPLDVVTALALGWALPVVLFRVLLPDEAFPVTYRRGNRAHLDVGGQRGRAIGRALDQQLGLTLLALSPFGLGGSAGSTPLQLRVRSHDGSGSGNEPERELFGKLYAVSHLRSDRWYKLSRTVLFGRLEDEKPFSSVRRLVEYEDHMLRLLRDAGLPVPEPYGIVEITPEREYLIVMEFFRGAQELTPGAASGDVQGAELDQAVIDDGLAVVRRLWDVGVAHRDIKPSNLLLQAKRVLLIDVAFATVRPTPWRQAVDLANMMLTLALRSTPERVYARALKQFAADDIAEAFAATRSITVPSQLRARIRTDGRNLPAAFRRLAPNRPPIRIQLWSLRRAVTTVGVVALLAIALSAASSYASLAPGGTTNVAGPAVPRCDGSGPRLALLAQAVPSASYVPCLAELPPGWSAGSLFAGRGDARFALVSDRAPEHPVKLQLLSGCGAGGRSPLPPRAAGVRTSIELRSISPRYAGSLFDVFPGGCVRYDFDFPRGAHIALVEDFESAVGLLSRREVRLRVHTELGVALDPS
ncbi:MAG TPA: lipopolysaccharide kinase InaA family protein [Frankiaceae bacterium]|nr:lipopolysaccharide kinase InaA family protein [Frankiaceae bacterium]